MMLGLGQSLSLAAAAEHEAGGAAPVIEGWPILSGVYREEEWIHAIAAAVTGTPTPVITWLFQRGSADTWMDMAAEQDGDTILLSDLEVGKQLKVWQIATNVYGSTQAVSGPSSIILEAPTSLWYFNAVSTNWNDLGNWFQSSSPASELATHLPNPADLAYVFASVETPPVVPVELESCIVAGTGVEVTLDNLTCGSGGFQFLSGSINRGTLVGNCHFSENSQNQGYISGDVNVHYPGYYPFPGVSGQINYHSFPTGCTDPSATNYDPSAIIDDASCYWATPGCTDYAALNYDPSATIDDGSCIYS